MSIPVSKATLGGGGRGNYLPVGTHPVQIINAEEREYNGRTTLFIEMQELNGTRTITDLIDLQPQSRWRASQVATACGLDWEEAEEEDDGKGAQRVIGHVEVTDFVNSQLDVRVELNKKPGDTRTYHRPAFYAKLGELESEYGDAAAAPAEEAAPAPAPAPAPRVASKVPLKPATKAAAPKGPVRPKIKA